MFNAAFVGSKDEGASGIAVSPPALAATGHNKSKTVAQNTALCMPSIERPLIVKHRVTFVTPSNRSC
jgi:hypothetical protein